MQASGVFLRPKKPPPATLANSWEKLVWRLVENCPKDLKRLIGVAEMIGRTP